MQWDENLAGQQQRVAVCLRVLEQMPLLSDCTISQVELYSLHVGVNSIPNLVVATFVRAPEIKPDLGYVGI
jgi:hypothetical protein